VLGARDKVGVRFCRTPQTNGQDELANRVILRGLKRILEKAKGTWSEEIPRILWSYPTTPQSTTKETPFSLVYGSDVMIPVEIQENSPRFQSFVVEESNEGRKVNLDLLDEVHDHAHINSEALKIRVELKHKTKTKHRQFKVADLVMRKAHPYQLENKLSPKWAGPFRVVEVLRNGAYKLETWRGESSHECGRDQSQVLLQFKTFRFDTFLLNNMMIEVTLFFP